MTLKDPKRITARLTIVIDGTPQLPTLYRVRNQSGVQVLEEFPGRGELQLKLTLVRSEPAIEVWVNASGFATASAKFIFVDDVHQPSATVELVRTASLIARIKKPEKDYVRIMPQRYDVTKNAWGVAKDLRIYNGRSYANGPGGFFIFSGLTPGRWRVIDERSGLASEGVELIAGDTEVHVELDLGSIEWVAGRVELQDLTELSRVRVLVERTGAGAVANWKQGAEPPDGSSLRGGAFRVRVPSDEEVTIVPWHPWLVPALESGRLTLRGGREGVVLRLESGDELRLPVPQIASHQSSLRLARYPACAVPDREPLEWHHAAIVDGVMRCSLPRGSWTLWIDPGARLAPLTLRDVAIDGLTELPAAQFTKGSTLRVRILTADGEDAPRIYAIIEHLGAPAYYRSINSRGDQEVLISGLGAGRYKVRLNVIMNLQFLPEREIEVDGVADAELELDLR